MRLRHKSIINFLVIQIILVSSLFFLKAKSAVFHQKIDTIRVGISTNDFSKLEYNQVSLSCNGEFEIKDKNTDKILAKSNGQDIFTIKITDRNFSIYNADNLVAENIDGPVNIKSSQGYPIDIVGLKRAGKQASYRGELEIVKTKSNLLSVVNILPLEDYLKGVVPNELPVGFGLEALKAQAIAARNYAITPRVKSYKQFDICDSVACQVYFGYNTENPLANKAIEDTEGLLALYNGDIILALYSSTAGGYTENYENAFSDPVMNNFPASPKPYLKGVPDFKNMPALNNEELAKQFYTSIPPGFDVNSKYYRWSKSWTGDELSATLNKNLSKYSTSKFIYPKFAKGTDIGEIKNIKVLLRGVSGKAMAIKIDTDKGSWVIEKELLIRRIFENSGKSLPSANVVFNNVFDQQGNLVKIEAVGGGYGHGVGMSQYGAGYMSKNGFTFDRILQHYYTDISIGTSPIVLNQNQDSDPVKQEFNSPNSRADLVINNADQLDNLKVYINSREIEISPKDTDKNSLRIRLDDYIHQGVNEIVYYPSITRNPGKNIKSWIEIFKVSNN